MVKPVIGGSRPQPAAEPPASPEPARAEPAAEEDAFGLSASPDELERIRQILKDLD